MNLVQSILTQNDCYKGGRTIAPKGVMVHSVGCPQPKASVFIKNWNKPGVQACVHAFVDDTGVYQTLPWAHRGWHAGTGTSGQSANNTHISFECCEPSGFTYSGGATMVGYDVAKNEPFFKAVYQNAVELCAMLCKQYNLDPLADGVLIAHCEGYKRGIASNHGDVLHWWPKHGKNMDTFRAEVKAAMTDKKEETPMPVYEKLNDVPASYRPTIQKLMERKALAGVSDPDPTRLDDNILKIDETYCRVMTTLDKLGKLD